MPQSFSKFIKSCDGKLYRDLIEHHYKKQDDKQINISMFATAELISEDFIKDMEEILF